MGEEFIPRAIPRVKVALYGPSGVGKTLFRNMLLRKDPTPPKPSEKSEEEEVLREYKRPTEYGVSMSVEKYRLTLIDVPGRPELRDERVGALSKVVGWIFMYDATSSDSAKRLEDMIKEELESARRLKSAIAMIVVGTKKDLGVNDEAVKIGEGIASHLSEHTKMFYGYSVPHILISCTDVDEVLLTFLCLESINFDLKPSDLILSKLGEKQPKVAPKAPTGPPTPKAPSPPREKSEVPAKLTVEMPSLPTPPKEALLEEVQEAPRGIAESLEGLGRIGARVEELPEIPSPQEVLMELERAPEPSVGEAVAEERVAMPEAPPELPKQPTLRESLFSILEDEDAWQAARAITSIPYITHCYIVIPRDGRFYVSHEGEKTITDEQREFLNTVASAIKLLEDIVSMDAVLVHGVKRSIAVFRGKGLIVLETEPRGLSEMMLLAPLISGEAQPLHNVSHPSEYPEVSLSSNDALWGVAKRLRSSHVGISRCYIVERSDDSYKVAHDGEGELGEEEGVFIKRILLAVSTMDTLVDLRYMVIIGQDTVFVAKNRGLMIIRVRGRISHDLLSLFSAVS